MRLRYNFSELIVIRAYQIIAIYFAAISRLLIFISASHFYYFLKVSFSMSLCIPLGLWVDSTELFN